MGRPTKKRRISRFLARVARLSSIIKSQSQVSYCLTNIIVTNGADVGTGQLIQEAVPYAGTSLPFRRAIYDYFLTTSLDPWNRFLYKETLTETIFNQAPWPVFVRCWRVKVIKPVPPILVALGPTAASLDISWGGGSGDNSIAYDPLMFLINKDVVDGVFKYATGTGGVNVFPGGSDSTGSAFRTNCNARVNAGEPVNMSPLAFNNFSFKNHHNWRNYFDIKKVSTKKLKPGHQLKYKLSKSWRVYRGVDLVNDFGTTTMFQDPQFPSSIYAPVYPWINQANYQSNEFYGRSQSFANVYPIVSDIAQDYQPSQQPGDVFHYYQVYTPPQLKLMNDTTQMNPAESFSATTTNLGPGGITCLMNQRYDYAVRQVANMEDTPQTIKSDNMMYTSTTFTGGASHILAYGAPAVFTGDQMMPDPLGNQDSGTQLYPPVASTSDV